MSKKNVFRILRVVSTDDHTSGVLMLDKEFVAYTLENPWKSNSRNVSCIPFGYYEGNKITSPRFGLTMHLTPVTGRSEIIIHAGNTTRDTEGCILLGLNTNWKGKITNSRLAVERFRELIKDIDKATFIVQESPCLKL